MVVKHLLKSRVTKHKRRSSWTVRGDFTLQDNADSMWIFLHALVNLGLLH